MGTGLRRIKLGLAGEVSVSPLCVGMVSDPDTVIAAWDAGVNFFFLTADMHWPVYQPLREGLKRLAAARPAALDEAVIACTTYVTQPEFLLVPHHEALASIAPFRKLGVLVAGGAYGHEIDNRLAVLKRHVAQRALPATLTGASMHDRAAGVKVVNDGAADVVFVRYNPSHPGAQLDFFPLLAKDRTTRVFNFKSTVGHHPAETYVAAGVEADVWFPSKVDYYRFALTRPELDGVLCAPATPREIEETVAAVQQGPLAADEEAHLLALASALLEHSKATAKIADAGVAG